MGTENNRLRRYWASRPDRDNLEYFWTELQKGRMRQGWDYDDSQNLSVILEEMQKGGEWWGRLSEDQLAAYRNYPFHPGWGDDTMREGDIVLREHYPFFNLRTGDLREKNKQTPKKSWTFVRSFPKV